MSGEPLAASSPFLLEGVLGQSGLAALAPVMGLARGTQKTGSGTRAWLTRHVCDLGKSFLHAGQPQFPHLVLWEGCATLLVGLSFHDLGGLRQT